MHKDLIFNAPAGIGSQAHVLVRLEGGDSLDQPDGTNGDQIVLISGLGIVLLGRVKQKEEFSRSKTTP